MEKDLGLSLEREQERVSFGSLEGRENVFGVEGLGAGIIALDLAGSDRGNRWKMFAQGAAVVKLNPEESMVTVH